MGWNLWGFNGRLNRAKYWAITFSLLGILIVLIVIGVLAFKASGQPTVIGIFGLSILLVYAVMLWISVAAGVKRLHDRNKSGWLVLLFLFVPEIFQVLGRIALLSGSRGPGASLYLIAAGISIWAFVELGCLRGTVGENRYGRDPLGAGIEQVFE